MLYTYISIYVGIFMNCVLDSVCHKVTEACVCARERERERERDWERETERERCVSLCLAAGEWVCVREADCGWESERVCVRQDIETCLSTLQQCKHVCVCESHREKERRRRREKERKREREKNLPSCTASVYVRERQTESKRERVCMHTWHWWMCTPIRQKYSDTPDTSACVHRDKQQALQHRTLVNVCNETHRRTVTHSTLLMCTLWQTLVMLSVNKYIGTHTVFFVHT